MAVSELLLQSVGDVIRVFPAWPKGKPAQFHSLRAQGGFLVSAVMAEGGVKRVSMTSTVGGPLRLLSPWQEASLVRNGKPEALAADERRIITLETRPDDRLTFASGARMRHSEAGLPTMHAKRLSTVERKTGRLAATKPSKTGRSSK
jgi:hypothetical protein